MQLIQNVSLHAVLEVIHIGYLVHRGMFQVKLIVYGGSVMDLTLYTGGDEPCPFQIGDYYQTDVGERGGWSLTRLPQNEIDQLKESRKAYDDLSPAQKRLRTISMQAIAKRHRARDGEPVCPAVWPPMTIPGYTLSHREIPCQYVEGHSGNHWNGRGMGEGYTWNDSDLDDNADSGLPNP